MDKKIFDFYANVHKKDMDAFNDALPIGNGTMGAMIYGNVYQEKMVLNEDSVWLGEKNRKRYNTDSLSNLSAVRDLIDSNKLNEAESLIKKTMFSSPKGANIYTLTGLFFIDLPQNVYENYQRIMDLDNGKVEVNYEQNGAFIKRVSYASYVDQVIVHEITSTKPMALSARLDREKLVDSILTVGSNEIELKYTYNTKDYVVIRVKALTDGHLAILGNQFVVQDATYAQFLITMRSTYRSKYPELWAKETLEKATIQQQDLLNRHIKDYQNLYHRQSFITNDEDLTYMYNFARYLLISSSRIGSLPANLQGIWNQDLFPAWDSKYTININTQMNYWNVYGAGLHELAQPLFEHLAVMHSNGKEVALKMYGARGFVAHHNTDIYGDCAPQDHYLPATTWVLGAAWLSLIIWEDYTYTKDKNRLKTYYHILEDAALFFVDYMIKDTSGYKVISPSLSPENSFYQNGNKAHITKGVTMDDQVIKDLMQAVLSAGDALDIQSPYKHDFIDILNHLKPLSINQYGTIAEWHQDYEEAELGHRHISHLYGLFPSSQIKSSDTMMFDAAKATLERRLKHGGGHTGWSKAWIICMYARLNDGLNAGKNFKEFMKQSVSRVGLDLHPPFQIDGNFGVSAGIREMFIRFDGHLLELLPALPNFVTDATFTGIQLMNQLTVDIKIKNGELVLFTLCAKEAMTIQINQYHAHMKLPKEITLTPHLKSVFKV